ncbi:dihydropteroate synthase [Gimibacter soli]|uniref:Dihydropteroate synthase n=1 Tax=Gimibacter soli TaxID=3024400 RepID=A0AAE9XPE3_9PROT|nr:dihydropteroate synthase [Gimibacter soli]WCL53782.1 dihydropteroate synthase [Gimibacter soli]
MPSLDLMTLPADARAYLIPMGGVREPGAAGWRLGGSGLRYPIARLIVRLDRDRVVDRILPVAEIETLAMPDAMRVRVDALKAALAAPRMPLTLEGGRMLAMTRPLVMAILNVTPDSFSDGGKHLDPDAAIAAARAMRAAGADIIDVGGESTRPGAKPVWEGEEAERILPVIRALAGDGTPISVDTRHASVMEKALAAGAHILNDVSALTHDPEALRIASESTAPVILMHAKGEAADVPDYEDLLLEVFDFLEARIEACVAAGIARERIIVDPGIGFGKAVLKDNLALMNNLALFHTLGVPLLVGASRKRFIGAATGVEEADKRLVGSLAAATHAVAQGTHIVRVHDVAETVEAMKLAQAFHDAAMMDVPMEDD